MERFLINFAISFVLVCSSFSAALGLIFIGDWVNRMYGILPAAGTVVGLLSILIALSAQIRGNQH